MAKQTFTAGQVLTAAEMNSLQENDYNWTVTTKTASYTLAAGDEGTRIVMNNAGATTITVDDAIFSAGDVVWIHNIGAGTCTVTAGTATVNTAADLELDQWEGGSLYFTSASSAIFFRGAAGVGNANFTDTETGTYSSGGKDYKYLTFTSSGTITIDTAGLCDILVVGGGGSGGQGRGGGGGAGGHLYATGAYLPVGTLTVTVGAGGAAVSTLGTSVGTDGNGGNSSSIADYISPGGGGGGGFDYNGTNYYNSRGDNGGSGGGASAADLAGGNANGGTGFALVGNDGGDGTTAEGAGGGGGAGAAGSNGSGSTGGAGGAGTSNSITGSAVDRAGGGGGSGTTAGAGGSGGGGAGSYLGVGTSGTANTGGGGGGVLALGGARASGSGGSGVVIVRVEV